MGVGIDEADLGRGAALLNCEVSSFPFTYLGLPVGGQNSGQDTMEGGDKEI